MQKHIVLLIPLLFLLKLYTYCQDFETKFKSLQGKNDTAGQRKLLTIWETATPKDPELYIAWFNYYVGKSAGEIVVLSTSQKNTAGLQLSDSGGKPVALLSSSINYNEAVLQKGFAYIDRGIALYPARLDMRFGKIYMLGEAHHYAAFADEITKTIDLGHSIHDMWL